MAPEEVEEAEVLPELFAVPEAGVDVSAEAVACPEVPVAVTVPVVDAAAVAVSVALAKTRVPELPPR